MTIDEQIREAAERYAEFHGEDAQSVDNEQISEVAFTVGELDAVSYTIIEDGNEVSYHHEFETPPCLAISSDGEIGFILAGEWTFTKRGFEG